MESHRSNTGLRLARALFLLTFALDVLGVWIGGRLQPDYSHVSQYISELNASGTPWGREIGLYLFLPLGMVMTAFLFAIRPRLQLRGISKAGFYLLYSYPAIVILGVIFPCDAGCPVDGSVSQALHNNLAALSYLMTAAGIILLSRASAFDRCHHWARPGLMVLGIFWLVMFVAMALPEFEPWRGAIQRLIGACVYLAFAAIAWLMPEAGGERSTRKTERPG